MAAKLTESSPLCFLIVEPNRLMRIAIATQDFSDVAGHAGQARHWLVYDSSHEDSEQPQRLALEKGEVLHHWKEDRPHPLDNVSVMIARSAGDAFVRRMAKRGVDVLLTSERDAGRALNAVLKGEVLPTPGFDPTRLLCRLRDLFSPH